MAGLIRRIFNKAHHISQVYHKNSYLKLTSLHNVGKLCSKNYSTASTPYEVVDPEGDRKICDEIMNKVNQLVAKNKQGRPFAVVHVSGKQFKVTEGDVIVVEGYWPPSTGDKISLDKVLVAGAADFSLIGRPIIQKNLVKVVATVIEKTLSHTKTHFRKKRRKQYMRINFYRIPQTMLRINSIEFTGEVNNPPEVRGNETAVF